MSPGVLRYAIRDADDHVLPWAGFWHRPEQATRFARRLLRLLSNAPVELVALRIPQAGRGRPPAVAWPQEDPVFARWADLALLAAGTFRVRPATRAERALVLAEMARRARRKAQGARFLARLHEEDARQRARERLWGQCGRCGHRGARHL